jgi:hypothetical protein
VSSQLVVVRWICWVLVEVVLCSRGPGVRQCLPRCFWWCLHCLAMCVSWLPLWHVAMGAVVLWWMCLTSTLHMFHIAHVVMIPNRTIMYQRNFGVDTVACMPRILVGGLSVDGGSWWFPHVCGLGALCGVMLSRLFVECWLCLEVVLRARAPGVRQCLPLRFCWCPHCLVVRVPWLPLWRVAMGAVVL